MTQTASAYNVKLLMQVDMPSSLPQCTETTNESNFLINTLYEVHAVPMRQQVARAFDEVSTQQSVLKIWKNIRRGIDRESHRFGCRLIDPTRNNGSRERSNS